MERIIHDLIQGTPEWGQFRLDHDGASEAAAMLGLSKTVTRSELLYIKHTGLPKEFSDFVQSKILDHGHEIEGPTRQMVEELIGEELYPSVWSYGRMSVSTDGLTMDGRVSCEIKQWNDALAAAVARDELPDEHQPQCQQNLRVTGAERLIFVVSDSTPERFVHMEIKPDQAWYNRIRQGWEQFHRDLAEYTPPEVIPAAVATPTMALPALSIQVNGSITLTDNLKVFGEKLTAFIDGLDKNPSDDQSFADSESAIKVLAEAQERLEAAEASALAQTADIDTMRRTVAMYANQARTTRLMLEKLVKSRKESIRVEIVQKGRGILRAHIAGLNNRLGKAFMPPMIENLAGVIKGKKTVASLRDAVDTEVARVKINLNSIADRIQVNMRVLRTAAGEMEFLFPDEAQLVLKAQDDLEALVKVRIADHKATEEKRTAELVEKERERIRQEEIDKLEVQKTAAAQEARPVVGPPPTMATPAPAVAPLGKPKVSLTASGPRPTDDQIIGALALTYRVHESKVISWLLDMDLESASQRMAKEFA